MARLNFEEFMEEHAIIKGHFVRKTIAEQLKNLEKIKRKQKKTTLTLDEVRQMNNKSKGGK